MAAPSLGVEVQLMPGKIIGTLIPKRSVIAVFTIASKY
jgi:hypothetical protein